jgi:hypothetical protein
MEESWHTPDENTNVGGKDHQELNFVSPYLGHLPSLRHAWATLNIRDFTNFQKWNPF